MESRGSEYGPEREEGGQTIKWLKAESKSIGNKVHIFESFILMSETGPKRRAVQTKTPLPSVPSASYIERNRGAREMRYFTRFRKHPAYAITIVWIVF